MSARNWTVPPGSALDSKSGVRVQTSPKSDINNSRHQVTMTYPELLTVALDFATAILLGALVGLHSASPS